MVHNNWEIDMSNFKQIYKKTALFNDLQTRLDDTVGVQACL